MAEIIKHFNRPLALSCLLIALSTFNYGFDSQGFATTQAMTPFARQFGTYNEATKTYALETSWLSLFNSLIYIGFGAGVVIGSVISSLYGRRWCMFIMSCWALVTATLVVTSRSRDQILAARILNYMYIGMELSVVPVFQAEIVPTPVRGFIVGTYQTSLVCGGIIVNCICKGTNYLPDNRAWRIPLGLFYVVPSIIISLIWFVPESPRWLLSHGKIGEAKESHTKLRMGTMTEEEIAYDFATIQSTMEAEKEGGRFMELWQGVNLKRTAIVIFINFFQQATGQAFASQYGAIFIKSIGTVDTFTMTIVNTVVNLFGDVICIYFVDKIGRKPLLLAGAGIQLAALLTMGGLGTATAQTLAVKSGIVAMVTVFAFGFSLGWAPLTYVVTTELPALRLRDQSQRTASMVNVVSQFVVNFSIPYMLNAPYANLHAKVGFVFGSMAVCALLFTYFFVPECKGKSLEDLDIMFHEKVPLRRFGSYRSKESLELGDEKGEKQTVTMDTSSIVSST